MMSRADLEKRAMWHFWRRTLSIQEQLPFQFHPEPYTVNALTFSCSRCKEQVRPSHYRGRLRRMDHGDLLVEAVGWCQQCSLLHWSVVRVDQEVNISKLPSSDYPLPIPPALQRRVKPRAEMA